MRGPDPVGGTWAAFAVNVAWIIAVLIILAMWQRKDA